MKIYALPNNYYDKVILDTKKIDDVSFGTLDEYLYRFPLHKRLVTAYVKRLDVTINISTLHDLFCDFDKIGYYDSDVHAERMESDDIYNFVTNRHVRNPIVWTTSTQRIQSYYFDSKYLKIGKYQSIARKNAHQYFKMQSTNNVINFSKVRTLDNIDKHNRYFTDRFKLEGLLKNFVESHIGTQYVVVVYDQTIEIRVESKNATIQIEFTKWDCEIYLIWGDGLRSRKKSNSFNDIFSVLKDNATIFDFYKNVVSLGDDYIKKYIESLNSLKKEHEHTINIMVGNIKYSIRELFKEPLETYFTPTINAYAIHNGVPERIYISRSAKTLRINRFVDFNTPNEIVHCTYTIGEKNFTKIAMFLFNMGVINVSLGDNIDDNFDYGLLAKGIQKNFAISFMKVPTTEASKMFNDFERFSKELDRCIFDNPNPEDTRVFKKYDEIPENTYFELMSYKNDRVRHIEEKVKKQREKFITANQFLEEYKKDIGYFS